MNSSLIYTYHQEKLINTFRKLWEQHVQWTRAFIISSLSDSADLEYVTARLLRNPGDFAEVLILYYGNDKANQFAELLRQHLLIAADLVKATKNSDSASFEALHQKWYANADQIASFLHKLNPYWDEDDWKATLYNHLTMTEDVVSHRMKGQYAADINQYDMMEEQALIMADMMSKGIIKQFRLH